MVLYFSVGLFGDIKCHFARVVWVSWGHPGLMESLATVYQPLQREAHWLLEMVKYQKLDLVHASGDFVIFNRRSHVPFHSQKNIVYAYFFLEGTLSQEESTEPWPPGSRR